MRASRPTTYEITLKNSANPGLPAPMAPPPTAQVTPKGKADDKENEVTGRQSPLEEIILNEGLNILADYVGLVGAKATGKPN